MNIKHVNHAEMEVDSNSKLRDNMELILSSRQV